MALSRTAQLFANEIQAQDWSDAHTRADGSRHNRIVDRTSSAQLTPDEADLVRLNVTWVVGQVLFDEDPNFDIHEFAAAAGVSKHWRLNRDGRPSGAIPAGLRARREPDAQRPEEGRGTGA